ncbi:MULTISPECIES: hypothetical protein [Lysinibacillus]|uniref:Aminotransferase yhxA n=1 Tax=Lysinibacillus antri TaxID=2498145 RepID=A0A3S0P6C4_9BACI|nr:MULTISPECIES: hypothetical protein [Lysinibacillus]RUL56879.1 hypothetical protein EK386_00200 [Lysinibacillus antri]TSI08632.1 hypothetical protein FJQ64_06665 [Lysinibacillus sp. BW-2-10]
MLKKTKKMMMGVVSATLVTSLAGCGSDRPAKPTGYDCDDWEWDSDAGTYYCDDDDSTHSGGYYHGGTMYKSKKALQSSSAYQTYYSNYKSGIGSGTKGGFGG